MIRVYLVDDHSLVRAGLSRLLNEEPDIEVVGQAADGWAALRALTRPGFEVDVVLLDLSMPRIHGTEVVKKLATQRPELAVLVVSMFPEDEFGPTLVAEGAAGYLCKDQSDQQLIVAVRTVASGHVFLSRNALRKRPVAPHHTLTPRELQVFVLLIEGRQPTDIAAELDLGASTVSTHIGHIRDKLGARSIGEILNYAYRHGLIG